jgi:hypothetical protein
MWDIEDKIAAVVPLLRNGKFKNAKTKRVGINEGN